MISILISHLRLTGSQMARRCLLDEEILSFTFHNSRELLHKTARRKTTSLFVSVNNHELQYVRQPSCL